MREERSQAGNKKSSRLKKGWTTGTCAQAATRAAADFLLMGIKREKVRVCLPSGKELELSLEECIPIRFDQDENVLAVRCAIRKYSGDDPDITNNALICSTVSMIKENEIVIDGGEGVGRVTKPGLDQPVGNAAINSVPRKMIEREAREAREMSGYTGGLSVLIEIPEGRALAKKTFNPRLGIEGGLSVLGTSGIVEPMSEQALIDTIEVEIKVKLAAGNDIILASPGNYGLDFLREKWQITKEETVKCSNYVGDTIDLALEHGAKGLLFAAHIGKFVKIAGGIMNTHSRWGDCRMEILSAAALRGGLGEGIALDLLGANTTEEALHMLNGSQKEKLVGALLEKIHGYLNLRSGDAMKTGAIIFYGKDELLGMTEYAPRLLEMYQAGKVH